MSIRHIIPASVSADERRKMLFEATGMLFLVQLRKAAYQAANDAMMFMIYSHMEATLIARVQAWKAVQS